MIGSFFKQAAFCLAVALTSPSVMAETAKPFAHPGMLHSKAELAFIKEKLSSGEEPWKSAWEQLRSADGASLTYNPDSTANVVRGVRNKPNIGSSKMSSDASMIQTMIAMGIFLDDRAMFDRATTYFLSGEGNGAITRYLNHFGECQESGRDQVHTQMGLGYLGCACEMAWKQGVDLYGAANNRLALGFEYTAKYNLGEEVPYEPYRSVEGRYHYLKISKKSRGRFRPIFERTIHHYHDRMELDMPYSGKVAQAKRPEAPHGQHISWGTLMSYGQPCAMQSQQKK